MQEEIYKYLQQLHACIQQQEARIRTLETQVTTLQKEVEEIKKKPLTIEKIEYKFDQLKVETLEGTLNIGLNPLNEPTSIEDFEITNQKVNIRMDEYKNPTIEQDISSDIHTYLTQHGLPRIRELEGEYRIQLTDQYRQLMIEDIRVQVEPRIPYYFSQMQQHPEIINNPALLKETILQKMIQDIDQAFIAFIQHFPTNLKKDG
ncbi:spore germination protein GerPC [Priestia taiwanensis]|uniref:Germination protein PC n=1 Tax=Priestia taiwanensis TaxID=1347902 RepID=A0A917AV54_9BACI|nr:spore germination protein GerPC [Priestia taiwanensis]MBM7364215.1 spore germination protein PC [Priestia taiwanensis]GGE72592.1 germination protein PC [Priestia taiwanensis]